MHFILFNIVALLFYTVQYIDVFFIMTFVTIAIPISGIKLIGYNSQHVPMLTIQMNTQM